MSSGTTYGNTPGFAARDLRRLLRRRRSLAKRYSISSGSFVCNSAPRFARFLDKADLEDGGAVGGVCIALFAEGAGDPCGAFLADEAVGGENVVRLSDEAVGVAYDRFRADEAVGVALDVFLADEAVGVAYDVLRTEEAVGEANVDRVRVAGFRLVTLFRLVEAGLDVLFDFARSSCCLSVARVSS